MDLFKEFLDRASWGFQVSCFRVEKKYLQPRFRTLRGEGLESGHFVDKELHNKTKKLVIITSIQEDAQ